MSIIYGKRIRLRAVEREFIEQTRAAQIERAAKAPRASR